MTSPASAKGGGRRWIATRIERAWQSPNALSRLLYPVSLVYRFAVAARRASYRHGVLTSTRVDCPVVVVGNITVGGNGKTPFTAWLTRWLADRGLRPGIVLRGYRGASDHWPLDVGPDTPAATAGDEAVLLARLTGAPVVAGPDRVAACRHLLDNHPCDVIVSDDGLQHLALSRDFEIALHDAAGQGNGWCLPAGPLREPVHRLAAVDLVIPYGDARSGVTTRCDVAIPVREPGEPVALRSLAARSLLAMTAIARPERFFDSLAAHDLAFDRLALPDHHAFTADDIPGSPYDVILVTEKDAVKLAAFPDPRLRAVPLEFVVAPAVIRQLEQSLLPRLEPAWSTSTS